MNFSYIPAHEQKASNYTHQHINYNWLNSRSASSYPLSKLIQNLNHLWSYIHTYTLHFLFLLIHTAEPNLKTAAVTHLPPQYSYTWHIAGNLKKIQEQKLGSEKFKGRTLCTDIELLPDYTEPNNKRMVKLKMKLALGGAPDLLEHDYKAYVSTTLYDSEASQILGQYSNSYKFADGKTFVRFLINLGSQERVEKSTSRQLEVRVEVKVYGTNKYKLSDEGNGYMSIVMSGK